MASARRLYRLYVALAAAAAAALLVAVTAAGHAVTLAAPSVDAWMEACRRFVVPHLTPVSMMVLGLIALVVTVLIGGLRSFWRQLRRSRRYVRVVAGSRSLRSDAGVLIFDDEKPRAFCAGFLRPQVYISSGAVAALTRTELDAVLAHERHHALRRDPLRILLARTVADAMFFVPALRRMADRYGALAELAADEAAITRSDGHRPLASALLVFGEHESPTAVVGIAPERVDHLLGEPPRWRLPLQLVALSGLIVGALVAISLLAGHAAAPIDLPMLAASGCMFFMAVAAALFGVWVAFASRSLFTRR